MHSLHLFGMAFFDICRLRLGPQDLPASFILFKLTLIIYIILGITSSVILDLSFSNALLSTLLDTILIVSLTSSLLFIVHLPARILQTLTALLGTTSLLSLLSLPIIFWIEQAERSQSDQTLPGLLLVGLFIWNFVVYAHILRHALTVPFFVGSILTMVTFMVNFTILNQLFSF